MNGPTSWYNVIDMFGTYDLTQKLQFAFNYDYGYKIKRLCNNKIGQAIWQGIAGYINYHFTDKLFTSIRMEIFADVDGYRTGVKQNLSEITLTLGFIPIDALEIRAETRHDFSNAEAFLNKSHTHTGHNQQSYALDMLLKF